MLAEQQRLVRELHVILMDMREDAMRVLCALVVLLGPRFLIFRSLVARSLRRAGIESHQDYDLLVDRLLKSIHHSRSRNAFWLYSYYSLSFIVLTLALVINELERIC